MRALIWGAGIAGLALARLLDAMGWQVGLVKRATGLRDFFGPGFDATESMDLLPRLGEKVYTVNEVNYLDDSGRPRAALNYQRMVRSLDGRLLSLSRSDLARALHEGLSQRVRQQYGSTVRTLDQSTDRVTATLTDETRWSGDLLVGADGIHSTKRDRGWFGTSIKTTALVLGLRKISTEVTDGLVGLVDHRSGRARDHRGRRASRAGPAAAWWCHCRPGPAGRAGRPRR
jgi:2-polyprenyl-6-methoxyphenol hydroxylase-like FAD-dependent oxidoreductase